jgi:hypothetical protein
MTVRQRRYQNHGNMSVGSEIEKEKSACEPCSVKHEEQTAKLADAVLSSEPLSNPVLAYPL